MEGASFDVGNSSVAEIFRLISPTAVLLIVPGGIKVGPFLIATMMTTRKDRLLIVVIAS